MRRLLPYLIAILSATSTAAAQGTDFNGDGLSDLVAMRPTTQGALLFIFGASPGGSAPREKIELGVVGDTAVPGHYDADAVADLAVTHVTPGGALEWAIIQSSEQTGLRRELHVIYGLDGDKPLPADYDGDGRSDICVVRADPNGFLTWYPAASGGTPLAPVFWGLRGDYLLAGDVDGDSRSDYAVVRVIGGELVWFIRNAAGTLVSGKRFGLAGDVPALDDFNGDGIAEISVSRDINGSKVTIFESGELLNFGLAGDLTMFGRFNTPQAATLAVWRAVNGQGFFFFQGSFSAHPFSVAGDRLLHPRLPTSSTGSLFPTSTAPQLKCAQRSFVTRQGRGFEWKPVSNGDGRLAVLFGSALKGKILKAALVVSGPEGDRVVETLRFVGNKGGSRPTFRAAQPGSAYPPGVILVRQDVSGNNSCIDVPEPARAVR